MAWQVLSSRLVADLSPWLTVTTQEVRLPNGTVLPDYVLAPSREFSMVVAQTEAGQILLVRQYKHGTGHESIEVPAGYLDSADEPPLACAQRELREETGYTAEQWTPLGSFALDANRGPTRCHLFCATGLRLAGAQHLDASEALSVFAVDPSEALALLLRGEIECIACGTALTLGLLHLGHLQQPPA